MKSRIAIGIFSLAIAILSLSLGGCSSGQNPSQSSAQIYSENSESNSSQAENSENSSDNSSSKLDDNSSDDIIPKGEPTFLIGADGNAILTSEITRLENTDKTAETLTKDDLWAMVYCDGFAYCKESLKSGYDSHKNPDLFDGYDFRGETPENKNEWKRVNVGEEICGLKVKSASVCFEINDYDNYKFTEHYLNAAENVIELDGTVEVEGFLQVNNRSVQYPETDELVWFYPTSIDLPLTPSSIMIDDGKGFKTSFDVRGVFDHSEFMYAGEFDSLSFGAFSNINCDTDGIGVGDIAYARVTLGNIKCSNSCIEATLENIKLLSDILAHTDDDTTGGHGTMGRE